MMEDDAATAAVSLKRCPERMDGRMEGARGMARREEEAATRGTARVEWE